MVSFFKRARLSVVFVPIVLFFAAFTATADEQNVTGGEPMRLEPHPHLLRVTTADGQERARFTIEIADHGDERSRGLMFRTDLPEDGAMLFVFEDEDLRYFWMKNTPAPLDIIYANSAGEIVSIAKSTTPFSLAPIPSLEPARFALEVHAGVADAKKIAPGDLLVHPEISGN